MANFFDQFDNPVQSSLDPVEPTRPSSSSGNFFDQFDEPEIDLSPDTDDDGPGIFDHGGLIDRMSGRAMMNVGNALSDMGADDVGARLREFGADSAGLQEELATDDSETLGTSILGLLTPWIELQARSERGGASILQDLVDVLPGEEWKQGIMESLREREDAATARTALNPGGYERATGAEISLDNPDPMIVLGDVAESAAGTLSGMLGGAGVAKGAVAGLGKLGVKEKAAKLVGTMFGYGSGEGLISGLASAREVKEEILDMPLAKLAKSDEFQALLREHGDSQKAREELAKLAARQTFWETGAVTAALGAPMGPLYDRLFSGLGTSFGKFALGEGAQETLQSGAETVTGNRARQLADPTIETTEGAGQAMLRGGLAGMVMGGGLGGAGRAPSQETREQEILRGEEIARSGLEGDALTQLTQEMENEAWLGDRAKREAELSETREEELGAAGESLDEVIARVQRRRTGQETEEDRERNETNIPLSVLREQIQPSLDRLRGEMDRARAAETAPEAEAVGEPGQEGDSEASRTHAAFAKEMESLEEVINDPQATEQEIADARRRRAEITAEFQAYQDESLQGPGDGLRGRLRPGHAARAHRRPDRAPAGAAPQDAARRPRDHVGPGRPRRRGAGRPDVRPRARQPPRPDRGGGSRPDRRDWRRSPGFDQRSRGLRDRPRRVRPLG